MWRRMSACTAHGPKRRKKRALTQEEVDDLREMLQVRGLRKPPEYDDEPREDRSGLKGGGGRKPSMGMKPQAKGRPKKRAKGKAESPKRARLDDDAAAMQLGAEDPDDQELIRVSHF